MMQPALVRAAAPLDACQGTNDISVCTRESVEQLGPVILEAAAAPVARLLPPDGHLVLLGPGASGADAGSGAQRLALQVFQHEDLSRDADEITLDLTHQLTGRRACDAQVPREGQLPPVLTARMDLQRDLAGTVLARLKGAGDDTAFARLSDEEFANLYATHRSAILACTMTWADLR